MLVMSHSAMTHTTTPRSTKGSRKSQKSTHRARSTKDLENLQKSTHRNRERQGAKIFEALFLGVARIELRTSVSPGHHLTHSTDRPDVSNILWIIGTVREKCYHGEWKWRMGATVTHIMSYPTNRLFAYVCCRFWVLGSLSLY